MNKNRETLMKFISAQNQKVQNDISKQGYKRNSPYVNNPFNIIQGTDQGTPITMQDVDKPLIGIDSYGNKQYMQPGQEYYFPGPEVKEIALAKYGGLLNKTINCSNCGWSWKAADGGNDVSTCHKCGAENRIMQDGGPTSDMKSWFAQYAQSPLYRRNLESSGYEDVDTEIAKRLSNIDKTKYVLDENRKGTYYNPTSRYIHNAPLKDVENWKGNAPENESILAHEFGHSMITKGAGSRLNKYDVEQLGSRNKNKTSYPQENYADQKALQYEAAKLGIYNPGYEEFTKEHLNKLKNTGHKSRALENYSDEDLIWLMNNIAQVDDQSQMPIAQMGGATRADSLAIYNNTRAVEDYFKKQGYIKEKIKDSKNYKEKIKNSKDWINSAQKYLKEAKNESVDSWWTQADKNKKIAEETKYLKKAQKRFSETVDEINPKNYIKKLEDSKKLFETKAKDVGRYVDEQNNLVEGKPSIEKFSLPVDENKFYQRELSQGFLDLRSPMPLYDKRITPQDLSRFKSPDSIVGDQILDKIIKSNDQKEKELLEKQMDALVYSDNVEMYEYEPLAIMPFDMVPLEQQEERIRKYGTSGVPQSVLDLHPEWVTNPITNSEQRRSVQGIQNNLQPRGMQIEASVPVIRQQARAPRYYDVQDVVHGAMGDSTSDYKWYPANGEALQQIAPEPYNTRTMVPRYQVGGENMYTVSGQPLVIPSQESYPFDYNNNLPVNEAGMSYITDKDGKKVLLSSAIKVPTKDEFGKQLTRNQIAYNQDIWNDQKEAYSPDQQSFNIWKNNEQNTQQGYYNPQEYYDLVKKLNKRPDVGQQNLQTSKANKRGEVKGSCSTGDSMGGDCLKDINRDGGLVKYQTAGAVKKWLGNTLTPEGYITSTTKGGNYISFTGNQRADEWINKQLDSGKFGFDPATGGTFPLKKPVKGLSKKDQFIGSESYYNLTAPEGFSNESQRAQIKNLSEWQQDVVNAENEKRRKSYVNNNMQEVVKHPLFSPGYFTPEGAIIGSIQAGLHSANDLSEGNYKGAAINAGIAALPFLPKIANAKILPFGKRTLPEELTATYIPPRPKIEGVNDLVGESTLGEVALYDPKGHSYGYLTMTKGNKGATADVQMITVDEALRGHKAQDVLYQKAIQKAQEMGYPGLRSGDNLQLPEVTRKAHSRFNYVDEGLRGNTDVSVKTLTSHKNENIIPEWEQYYKTIRKPRENISISEAFNKAFPKKNTQNINLRLSGSGQNPTTSVPAIFQKDLLLAEQELARANADAAAFSNSPFNRQKLQEFRPNQEFNVSNQQARFIDDPVLGEQYQTFRNNGNLDYPENVVDNLGNSRGNYLANNYGDMNDVVMVNQFRPSTSNVPTTSAYTDAMHELTHSRSIRLKATPQEEKIASEAWEPMIKTNDFGMPAEEAFAVQNELRASLGDIKGNRVYTEKDIPEIKTKLESLINTGHGYLKGVNVEDFNMSALIKSLNKIGLGAAVPVTIGAGLLDQKKYGGLTKYQFKGEVKDEREGMMKTRDNVPTFKNDFELLVKRQIALEKAQRQQQREAIKKFKALPKKEQEKILYEQRAQKYGTITQYTPDSKLSKFAQSMVMPFTALTDLYQKGEVRDNLLTSVINNPKTANAYDIAYLATLGRAASPYVASAISAVPGVVSPYANMIGNSLRANLFNVPGLSTGNIINGGFAAHGLSNVGPDSFEMYKNPSWSNAGSLGVDMVEMLPIASPAAKMIGEGATAIGRGVNTTSKAILEKAPVSGRNFIASQMMNRQIARGLPKEPLPERLGKIDLIDKGTVNVKNDFLKHFTQDQYDDFLKRTYARDASAYDNPMIEFKGYARPTSFFKGIGNNERSFTPLERTLRDFGVSPKSIKEGKLFKEKFCAPGSECAKSANAVTNRTFTDITANPFNVEQNAHNAWHLEDQMTRHGGQEVANFQLKVGDRVLMGNGVDQSTYVPGYTADRSVRHAGMYAGLHEDEFGNVIPLIFESGKNNAMYLNPVNYNFTGPGSAIKAIRPQQFIGPEFGEALVDKNIRYAFRDKPSVAKYSSQNKDVQKVLNEAEKHREVIKKTHDITNDEFDELLNSLVGIGVQETKLNGALPGSTLAKAKIQLQNMLTTVGLTEPIKQTLNVAKKTLNNATSVNTSLPKFPGASVIEMEAAKLSNSTGVSFQEALAQVKSTYQPAQRFTMSTPAPSKGMFRQKFQTELDRVSGLGVNLKGSNSIENGLGQMAVNYANVKKLYPNASPRQLMDLTTLMWNSPGKARNAELVDFYLFGKNNPDASRFNFDYVKKINNAKDKYINIHPQGEQEPFFELVRKNNYPEIQYKKGGKIR